MFFQHSTTHTTVSTGALLRTLRIINGTFVVIFYVSAVIHLTEELTHDQHYRRVYLNLLTMSMGPHGRVT